MPDTKTRKTASEVYDSVASPNDLLYHIAHARKENSDDAYDGDKLKDVAARRSRSDIKRFRETAELFRARSIPRD